MNGKNNLSIEMVSLILVMCFKNDSWCKVVREWLWNSRVVWSCSLCFCFGVV